MPLKALRFRPGLHKNSTSYSQEGSWVDGDKVRFTDGYPETIGGWVRRGTHSFLGTARSLFSWATLVGTKQVGIGTSTKFYIDRGTVIYDVTPVRTTTSAGDVTFSATDGSSTITVTDTAHGSASGDFVIFSGAASLGGVITAAVLNQEYEILDVATTDTYEIRAREVASIPDLTVDGVLSDTPLLANPSDTGNGGASVVGTYLINRGLSTAIVGTGFGTSNWSRGPWGSSADNTVVNTLRLWSQGNYGEDLVFNQRDGGIYYWDTSANTLGTSRAIALADRAGAEAETPTIACQVLVTKSRHVVCFACDPETDIGTQDPLLIRFCQQEDPLTWATTVDNSAGELRISSGSRFVTAIKTRRQILVFTDKSLNAMQYIGPPYTFGIDVVSENVTILGPNAAVAVDDTVYWMGTGAFYQYTGQATELKSTVDQNVFHNLNKDAGAKIFAGHNAEFSEVWWFYPSENAEEIDRYVTYNYSEGTWSGGTFPRTAWENAGLELNPMAACQDGYLYTHEIGVDDGSVNPPMGINAYLESGQMDLEDGQQFMFVDRLIPDVSFEGSEGTTPQVTMTLEARHYPGGSYSQTRSESVVQSAATPVELWTEEKTVRLRGRSIVLKMSSDTKGTHWTLGVPRIGVRPDGAR